VVPLPIRSSQHNPGCTVRPLLDVMLWREIARRSPWWLKNTSRREAAQRNLVRSFEQNRDTHSNANVDLQLISTQTTEHFENHFKIGVWAHVTMAKTQQLTSCHFGGTEPHVCWKTKTSVVLGEIVQILMHNLNEEWNLKKKY
jgi:hypothetical protein